jgi:hypothetical protein
VARLRESWRERGISRASALVPPVGSVGQIEVGPSASVASLGGSTNGTAAVLLHGWPMTSSSYGDVVALLRAAG